MKPRTNRLRCANKPFVVNLQKVTLSNTDVPERLRIAGYDNFENDWYADVEVIEGPNEDFLYFLSIRGSYFSVHKENLYYKFTKDEEYFYIEALDNAF